MEVIVKQYKQAVFIGRFQPFHHGHKAVIDRALEIADRVLVLVGSSYRPRCERHPFTCDERISVISQVYGDLVWPVERLVVRPIVDYTYRDEKWISQVQQVVAENREDGVTDADTVLVGHSKDSSNFFCKLFPQWKSFDVPAFYHERVLNATDIREAILRSDGNFTDGLESVVHLVPEPTAEFLRKFVDTDEAVRLAVELSKNNAAKASWKVAPYPVKHVTADAVCLQAGSVLLVKRNAYPGKGLWALPGGHVEEYETFFDASVRELREETKIDVPEPVLRDSVIWGRDFDDPYRSNRGRVITKAFLYDLNSELNKRKRKPGQALGFTKVKGSDDAKEARWWDLSKVRRDMMFEDHFDIMEVMIEGRPR